MREHESSATMMPRGRRYLLSRVNDVLENLEPLDLVLEVVGIHSVLDRLTRDLASNDSEGVLELYKAAAVSERVSDARVQRRESA